MLGYSRIRRLSQATFIGFCIATSTAALAQESTDAPKLALGRFHPSQAGDRLFGVQSPYVAGHVTPHAALLFDYGYNPLVLRTADKDSLGAIVTHQMFLHINASLALWNRVQVNVDAPLALVQAGESPSFDGRSFTSPSGFAFGDLRLGARVKLVGDYYDKFQLGIGGYVWIPTGGGNFVTDGTVRGLPQLIAGGRIGRSVYTAAVGPELRSSQSYFGTVDQGSMVTGGVGYGYLLGADEQIQLGVEASVSTVFSNPTAYNTNAEVMASGRFRFMKSFEAGIGAGPGLTSGVGTPAVRVIGMIAYSPPVDKPIDSDGDGILDPQDACKSDPGPRSSDAAKHGCPPDKDGDGIFDVKDACVDVPGVVQADPAKHGCPTDKDGDGIYDTMDACVDVPGVADAAPKKHGCPPDKDGDGIIDAQDACVDVPGVKNADAAKNGCPPDKDGDGVPDAKDACVDIPGIETTDAATNGCPGDTDGDKIRDDQDACPNEKGAPDKDPKQHGCPKDVRVTETEVIILQQVQFDTAKATIKKVSDQLLDEVANVLKDHPEITKIEVQGHTDDRGAKAMNEKLSDDRAKAVMAALIKRGIAADRLTAKGFGPNVPIGDNKTVDGRQKNRRVQFVILEKKPKAPKK